jgi:4-diphosphocytidyl-2-C-methyl-D-erythritol kinase
MQGQTTADMVTELARAKINLALHVLGRRADGYHELDSVVAFASVADELHVEKAAHLSFAVHGPFANAVPSGEDNLVLRAYGLVREILPLPPVRFELTKNLPVAAGIGGGSADAAAALRALFRMSGQKPPADAVQALALRLGADVPVCLASVACRMQGVGEQIAALEVPPAVALVLVNPGVACATSEVFRRLALKPGDTHGKAIDLFAPQSWRNDLEAAARATVPEIGSVLEALHRDPVLTSVRMSGSGATCFALASSLADAQSAAARIKAEHAGWWVVATELR